MDLMSRRRELLKMGGGGAEPWITYQVYSPANTTRAVYSGSIDTVARMMMGDTEITPTTSMAFVAAGYYDFKILLASPATIPSAAFNAGHYYNVVLPDCVTYIDTNAFRNYSTNSASSVLTCLAATPPSLNGDPFANRHIITLKVPSASLAAYQAAWSMMQNIQSL